MRLWYPKGSSFDLTAFSDADHAGCNDSRKSISGGIQFIGDKLVSWISKKQNCIAMSSVKAEYVALSASCAQVMWMRTQLQDYSFNYNKILLYCDSQTKYQLADMFTKSLPKDRFKYLVRQIVIKNGNKVLKKTVGTSEQTYEPTLAEERLDRRNETKARGTLLMELPNKDQLKFHSYQDVKLLIEAIDIRYGGNEESKKRNKTELKTISLDDLYNNLKIYEPELSGSSNTNQYLQNMAFVSSNSTSSTNEADTTSSGVSIAHIEEEIDLHWEIAMLTIRARRFMNRIDRNLDINGRRIGFEKSKVECFNCYKNDNFARECRAPKNQDNRGNYMSLKCDLKLIDEHIESVSVDVIFNIPPSDVKTVKTIDVNHKGVFSTEETKPVMKIYFSPLIIEDWHSDDESEVEISLIVEDVRTMRNNSNTVNHKNFANKLTHPYLKRGFVPQAVLNMSGKINTAGDTRPYNKFLANKSSIFHKKVNTVRVNNSTTRDRAVGNPQQKEYKEKGVIDSGCSRHMTGTKCYLTNFEAYDGGFVSFRDGKARISDETVHNEGGDRMERAATTTSSLEAD
nr:copia protein [Tanacetum cinerariifolium]